MAKENLKQHIVDTASALFYSNGYNSTGVNEIISKANIAKATLYHHFTSKEAIGIAYLDQKHEHFMAQLNNFVLKLPDNSTRLLAIFDYLRELFREDSFQGCWGQKMLGEIPATEKKIRNTIQRQKQELLTYLYDLVAQNTQLLSKAEIEKISQGLYLLYETAITESHLHKSDWPIHSAKNLASSLVLINS